MKLQSYAQVTPGKIFMIMYAAFGYFFASKMNRLIILMGPIASVLGGVAIGAAVDWIINQVWSGVQRVAFEKAS